MQTMDNNEAIVQINGTQVQAKLETALQSGQSTLLQVQPQSANGTLVLKMVDHQAAAFTDDSVKEWVKALALPDQKWATDLVRDLRRDGCVLTREVAKQFQQAAAAMPKGGDMQQWMQAAALAYKARTSDDRRDCRGAAAVAFGYAGACAVRSAGAGACRLERCVSE